MSNSTMAPTRGVTGQPRPEGRRGARIADKVWTGLRPKRIGRDQRDSGIDYLAPVRWIPR
ncbi:hypothetical protein [Nocardia sp. NPDC052566]|uniref:hypothetical protein n=1 Tax=Nocardia sp. NPDC052566 TaxID=3364330 RepID=UPI0037C4FB34